MLSIVSFIQNYVRKLSMISIMKYLREFIIGSSAFAVVPWLWSQSLLRSEEGTVNYDYYDFSLFMPIRRGLWNVFSLIISDYLGLTLRMRFLLITFIDWISTIILVKLLNKYNYNKEEWNRYYKNLLIKYIIHWNLIIYNLEKYL